METQTSATPDKPSTLIDTIRDPKNLATAGLVCYVLGFLIESVFYTSLGIANLEFARTKYIVTGALFLLYFLAFFYPFYATYRFVSETSKRLSDSVFYFPIFAFPAALLWTAVVSGLSSVGSVRPFASPVGLSPAFDWPGLALDAGKRLLSAISLTALVVLGSCLFFLIADLIRKLRGTPLSSTRWTERRAAIRALATTTLTTYLAFGAFGFLAGLSSTTVSSFLPGTRLSVLAFSVTEEWRVYWLSPMLVGFGAYALLSSALWLSWSNAESNSASSAIEPGSRTAAVFSYIRSWAGKLFVGSIAKALVPILIVPYATLVFPTLPPQLGGGKPIPASISFRQGVLQLDGGTSVVADVLVRGPSVIFLTHELTPAVIEVPAGSVDSIRYLPSRRAIAASHDAGLEGPFAGDGAPQLTLLLTSPPQHLRILTAVCSQEGIQGLASGCAFQSTRQASSKAAWHPQTASKAFRSACSPERTSSSCPSSQWRTHR